MLAFFSDATHVGFANLETEHSQYEFTFIIVYNTLLVMTISSSLSVPKAKHR